MKIDDLEFIYFGMDRTSFYKSAIFDKFRKAEYAIAERILGEATDTSDFIDRYIAEEELGDFYARYRLAKEFRPDAFKKFMDDYTRNYPVFYASSDAGGVVIGNDDFFVLVPNGEGDGDTRVILADGDMPDGLSHALNYFTQVHGKFNIYRYDCGDSSDDNVLVTVVGKIKIYFYEGTVIFNHIGD